MATRLELFYYWLATIAVVVIVGSVIMMFWGGFMFWQHGQAINWVWERNISTCEATKAIWERC